VPSDPIAEGAGYLRRPVTQVRGASAQAADDLLAEEIPIAVHYDGVAFAVMMATPHDLEDFAYGFSLTEGRAHPRDIVAIEIRPVLEGIFLDIKTRHPAPIEANESGRNLPGRSGCGICGSRLLEEVVKHPAPVAEGTAISATSLEAALEALEHRQPLNVATGATHAAAWAQHDGALALVREDVGRHNALDKLIGAMLRAGHHRAVAAPVNADSSTIGGKAHAGPAQAAPGAATCAICQGVRLRKISAVLTLSLPSRVPTSSSILNAWPWLARRSSWILASRSAMGCSKSRKFGFIRG
jgi:FdhD protein